MTLQCASCPAELITLLQSLTAEPAQLLSREEKALQVLGQQQPHQGSPAQQTLPVRDCSTAETSSLLKSSSQEADKVINAGTKPPDV